jgi:hypothetical protein
VVSGTSSPAAGYARLTDVLGRQEPPLVVTGTRSARMPGAATIGASEFLPLSAAATGRAAAIGPGPVAVLRMTSVMPACKTALPSQCFEM